MTPPSNLTSNKPSATFFFGSSSLVFPIDDVPVLSFREDYSPSVPVLPSAGRPVRRLGPSALAGLVALVGPSWLGPPAQVGRAGRTDGRKDEKTDDER